MSWLQKLKQGLSKTSDKLGESLSNIFVKKKLDRETLDELEELLIKADIGVSTSADIINELSKNKFDKEVSSEEIKAELAQIIAKILEPAEKQIPTNNTPQIILMCGVNGNGKTTTIGKLAQKYKNEGKKVTLAACDTFRAAAMDQLQVWADRIGVEFISGPENSDPASVAFKAVETAKANRDDIVLVDTAGRLHNKSNLMDELAKIIRTIKKLDDNAPHDIILVVDATTGQNALHQLEAFNRFVKVSGLIITKLDGTAKAGIVVALFQKFKIPIYAIGVGEKAEDLNNFSATEFSNSLLGI